VTASFSGATGTCRVVTISSVTVRMRHTWVGDLEARLTTPGGASVLLFSRPGVPPGTFGNSSDLSGVYTFSDSVASAFPEASGSPVPNGPWAAADGTGARLSMTTALLGSNAVGNWGLNIWDGAAGDTGDFDTITVTGTCN
jgi:subtilisin-like proprotein convertase family protein